MLVTNITYKRVFQLALTLLLAGCATDTENRRSDTLAAVMPQNKVPSAPKPVVKAAVSLPPAQSFSQPVSVPAPAYSARTLTGIYAYSQPVHDFIRHMVQKHGFSETYLNGLFSQATRLDSVIRLETAPRGHGPAKPGVWTRYRSKFLTDQHISHGVQFWIDNADIIQKASATYGVDPEYIVAIIGVETYFGRNVGKTGTFNALATLAFDTPRRTKFFTSELENFLLMTREEGFDPLEPVGSWAGAMGLGQFMPSSFRSLAVDFDHDGVRDLWNQKDAIGSVANYFSHSGWQRSKPVARQAKGGNAKSTIALSTYQGNEHWQVYPNFKVIKRYNNSNNYAMAVHQLAQAIKQSYAAKQGPALVMGQGGR